MDKLSDKIKDMINNSKKNNNGSIVDIKRASRRNTLVELLPSIENLEQEKEDLIDDLIKLIKSHDELLKIHFGKHSGIIYAKNAAKAFQTVQKLTGKSWDQITKEQ